MRARIGTEVGNDADWYASTREGTKAVLLLPPSDLDWANY